MPKLSSALDKEVDEKYYIPDEKARTIILQAIQRLSKLGQVHPYLTPNRVDRRQKGRRAKEDQMSMFTLTAQDIHGIIIEERNSIPRDVFTYIADRLVEFVEKRDISPNSSIHTIVRTVENSHRQQPQFAADSLLLQRFLCLLTRIAASL